MTRLDPRVQLAWLVAVVVGALFGGTLGVVGAAALAGAIAARRVGRIARPALAVLPLGALIALLDALAGDPALGLVTGGRVVALVGAAAAFAVVADGDALVDALRWLHIPFDVTFALVTGARLVPLATADVRDLADTARLRGLEIDGGPSSRLGAWSRLLLPLLVVTVRRGLRLGEAMEVRGFAPGRPRTARSRLRWTGADLIALGAAALYLTAVLAPAVRPVIPR
jgi:energy-coupling factor transporter transmembrane protein EcfT